MRSGSSTGTAAGCSSPCAATGDLNCPTSSTIAGAARSVRISVTDDRAKTKNLRRDPRASLHVTRDDFFAYVVLEGEVALSPVAAATGDAVVGELVEMYRTARGDHPDWDEFRTEMVKQSRLVATLTATRAYGMLGS